MALIDVQVPDIGDFDEVAVIEVLVNVGDTVAVDQSLVTVESDKASMEIPSSHAGVVKAMTVKLGDKVTKGSVLLQVEAQVDAAIPAAAATAAHTTAAPEAKAAVPAAVAARAPAVAVDAPSDTDCDLLVLGGGPGGYSA
ncbi:MAG: dihydrolipoyl dehydrogenase, partial [Burkholderiaceae bacterium]|nr:dihydrolipoyl dehydrogenase [Burkholderiaceae bacterium]